MTDKSIDFTLLFLTTALAVAAFLFPIILEYSPFLFLAVIVLLGIPHGALDHIFFLRKKPGNNAPLFYVKYLGLIVFTGVLWFIIPTLSFLLFLLISAYHFGQSQFYYIQGSKWLKHTVFLSWGTFILSLIIYANPAECGRIFTSLKWLDAELLLNEYIWSAATSFSFIVMVISLAYATIRHQIQFKQLLFEIGVLTVLCFLALVTNAVFTFTIYFGIWHSFRSLIIEYESIQSESKRISMAKFLVLIVPFSLVAIILMTTAYFILPQFLSGISPYMIFIIGISMLTVPHLFVMYDLYEKYA